MVAGDDGGDAFFQQIAANARRHAEPVGSVVGIDDQSVKIICFPEFGDIVENGFPSGAPDHIAGIDDSH